MIPLIQETMVQVLPDLPVNLRRTETARTANQATGSSTVSNSSGNPDTLEAPTKEKIPLLVVT